MATPESKTQKRPHEDDVIPVLVRFDNENRPVQYIYVNKNEFKIGRGLDNDEIFKNEFVSRAHCVFKKINENEWTVTNLSSSGTTINKEKLREPHTIQSGDIIQFVPTPEFTFTIELLSNEEYLNNKKPRLRRCIMDEVKKKQDTFAAQQEMQLQEMKAQVEMKEKDQNLLKSRLDELLKTHEAVQGEKNQEIKNLQEQIQAGNNQQTQLQINLTNLVSTLEKERQQFEQLLTAEKQKWQEELNMTKQQKEQFERDMRFWHEQQIAATTTEKQQLQQRLNQTENAFKEQQALAEKLQASLQEQQLVLAGGLARQQDCIIFKVDNHEGEQTFEILETIDLTNNESAPSTHNAKAKEKIMNAMDEQFTCSICSELFYKATTLSCSHTFCQYCINQWRRKSRECPICRTPIGSMNRALVLDNFIDEAVENLPLSDRERRNQMIKGRDHADMPMRQVLVNKLKPVKRR